MREPTPVESYLLGEKMISPSDLPPDKEIKPHLFERLKDWCIHQKITDYTKGDAWHRNLDSTLTRRGQMMCVELRLDADTLRDIDEFIDEHNDRLLLLLDWLAREQAKPLVALLADDRPSSWLPERWDVYVEGERRKLRRAFAPLEELLSRGGSAWRVDVDPAGLFERVTDNERKTFEEATSKGDAATEHLAAAWGAAWRLEPNGQVAFDEAVKAMEAVLRPIVTPNDSSATLGNVLGDLKSSQAQFTSRLDRTPKAIKAQGPTAFDNEGVQLVHGLVGSLWRCHKRHGQSEQRLRHNVEEGRDAVTLATALIAMQRRGDGFLRRAK